MRSGRTASAVEQAEAGRPTRARRARMSSKPASASAPAKAAPASALSSFCDDDDDDETAPPAPIVEPSVSDHQKEGPTILFVADPETDRPVCGCLQS